MVKKVMTQERAFPEKNQTGGTKWDSGLRIYGISQGYLRNIKWKFQGLIKNDMEFPRVIKKKSSGILWGF